MARKVLVIGLDSAPAEWVFDRWRHRLPNLSRLMAAGVHGVLESTIPPITVPAWMCMMTGRDPGELGIYGFRNRKDHSYDGLAFAGSRMVREEAVWDLLGQQGKRSILLGVPLTYPPPVINGVVVADFLSPGNDSLFTYPPEVKDDIRSTFGDYIFDVKEFRTDDKARLLDDIVTMTDQRFAVARHLSANYPWDLFVMIEMGPDRIQHGFWRFFDPAHPKYEPGNPYEAQVLAYYERLDRHVGELVSTLDDETLVLVVSDHGAQKMDGGVCINEWLIKEGYLALKQQPTSVTKISPSIIDWSRTRAWGDGGYYGRLFLNVKGREPEGQVDPGDYEALRSELIQRLSDLGDEDGRPIGTRVFRPQEVYKACRNVPPDLIVYFGNLDWRSVGSVGNESVWTRENDTGPDDANHSPRGIVIVAEAAACKGASGAGERRDGMSIYDIAPTIVKAFGLDVPDGMGRAAIGGQAQSDVYTQDEEEELARRLEDLGYL